MPPPRGGYTAELRGLQKPGSSREEVVSEDGLGHVDLGEVGHLGPTEVHEFGRVRCGGAVEE